MADDEARGADGAVRLRKLIDVVVEDKLSFMLLEIERQRVPTS